MALVFKIMQCSVVVLLSIVAISALLFKHYTSVRLDNLLYSQKVSKDVVSFSSEQESVDEIITQLNVSKASAVVSNVLSFPHTAPGAIKPKNVQGQGLESVPHAHKIASPDQDAELEMVLKNLDTCLATTNMRYLFERMNYMLLMRQNAEYFLSIIRKVIPKGFDPKFDIPCWKMDVQVSLKDGRMTGMMGNLPFNETCDRYAWQNALLKFKNITTSVACLPKVFIAGFPKCGSTYLYCALKNMPHIGTAQFSKEPHWWVATDFIQHNPNMPTTQQIAKYLFNFIPGSDLVQESQYTLTVDASPNMMFDWPYFVEGEPPVNYCLLPSLIPVILPDSKYIVVMRNPVTFLYSAFWYTCTMSGHGWAWTEELKLKAPTIFHERIVTKINMFNHCMQRQLVLEQCVLNITFDLFDTELNCGKTMMEVGFYYVHVHKWLSIIEREKFIFLTLEELSNDTIKTARELWKFVGIPHSNIINAATRKHVCDNSDKKNSQQAVDYNLDPRLQIRKDTEELLKRFYHPFNTMLADILNDNKFLWKEV